jgi:hypothetical protein
VISVVVFDYGPWVSNWAVCTILVMFAVRLLPSGGEGNVHRGHAPKYVLAWD